MNRLKELRKEKGLSLEELRRELKTRGILTTKSQLYYFETGKRKPRNDEIIEALANFYRVSVSYLLGYTKEYNSPVDNIEEIYVKLLEDIQNISDVQLADLKGFGIMLHDLAIIEESKRGLR